MRQVALETLERYSKLFPHEGLDVSRIQQVLTSAPQADQQATRAKTLTSDERQQFLQTALMMIDQNP